MLSHTRPRSAKLKLRRPISVSGALPDDRDRPQLEFHVRPRHRQFRAASIAVAFKPFEAVGPKPARRQRSIQESSGQSEADVVIPAGGPQLAAICGAEI